VRLADTFTESPFTLHRLEDLVPSNHPLHPIRQMVNEALVSMDGLFVGMYTADINGGRHRIAPQKLLRAVLLLEAYASICDCGIFAIDQRLLWEKAKTY
jgi:hypothetical protein